MTKGKLSSQDELNIAVMANDIAYIKENMVGKDRFAPIEKLVYGWVSLILIAVLGAMLSLVVR